MKLALAIAFAAHAVTAQPARSDDAPATPFADTTLPLQSADSAPPLDAAPAAAPATLLAPPATATTDATEATDANDACTARSSATLRVAVASPTGGGDDRLLSLLGESLVVELRKYKGLAVISVEEVKAMLAHEADKQTVGCSDDGCLAEIADALGVDVLVTLHARAGDPQTDSESQFTLRRLHPREGRAVGAVTKRLVPAHGEELLAAVGPAVAELFPTYPLREGTTVGVAKELALRLNPPPLPPWVMFTSAAGSVAAIATSLAAGALAGRAEADYQGVVADGQAAPVSGAVLRDKQELGSGAAVVANSAAVVGLVLGAAALIAWPFTDFGAEP